MRLKAALASIVGITLALTGIPSASQAAVVETVIDTSTSAVLGTVTFPTWTGDNAAGVFLSLGAHTGANITSISWSIDSSTFAVTALDLEALRGDNPCPTDGNCSNNTVSLTQDTISSGASFCFASGESVLCERFATFPTPVSFVGTPTPEPSTWAMMLVGFAGLGYAGVRRARKGRLGSYG